jgi:TPR repeat protein
MKNVTWKIALLCAAAALTAGCAAAVGEAAYGAKAKATYESNIDAANKGDKVAQFKVGEALCCEVNGRDGAYDTRRSVEYLCKSAAQGYGPAMYKLGRIYTGDTVDGVRLMKRAAAAAMAPTNPPIAYAWFSNAKAYGEKDAADAAQEEWKEMTPQQQEVAKMQAARGLGATCRWEEAMPK